MDPVTFAEARLAETESGVCSLLRDAQYAAVAVKEPRLLGREIPGWHSWPQVEALCNSSLREVEAKRAIIALHEPYNCTHPGGLRCTVCASNETYPNGVAIHEAWPCPTVRYVLATWADHPDYDKGWK